MVFKESYCCKHPWSSLHGKKKVPKYRYKKIGIKKKRIYLAYFIYLFIKHGGTWPSHSPITE